MAHGLKEYSSPQFLWHGGECEAADNVASVVRKQRDGCGAYFSFFFIPLYLVHEPRAQDVDTCIPGLPSSVKPLWKHPDRHQDLSPV